MHEYPITLEIIDIASRKARESGSRRVAEIRLVMGDNCGFLPESIEMYFDIIAEGGPCEGAKLAIERVEPKLRCRLCGDLFVRKPFEFSCPRPGCGGNGEPTEIGREFFISSITTINQ